MRIILPLIFTFLIWNNPLDCQSLVNSNHVWNIGDCAQFAPGCWTTRYQFDSDSILIDGKYYHELLVSREKQGDITKGNKQYLREENGQIWYRDDYNYKSEFLMYDFNLRINDTFETTQKSKYQVKMVVLNVDSVKLFDNIFKKRISLKSINSKWDTIQWVEGIGAVNHWLSTKWVNVLDGGEGWILCYSSNNKILFKSKYHHDCWLFRTNTFEYTNKSNYAISPNPTNDILYIRSANQELLLGTIKLYDQLGNTYPLIINDGQIDVSNLSPQLYFINYKNLYIGKFLKQ